MEDEQILKNNCRCPSIRTACAVVKITHYSEQALAEQYKLPDSQNECQGHRLGTGCKACLGAYIVDAQRSRSEAETLVTSDQREACDH